MINSRLITDLDLPARKVCLAHVQGCKDIGIELLVTSTYRDFAAQDDLYNIGRTKQLDRKPVTNARAGQSWHNFKCAYDVVPLIGGKAVWNDEKLWKKIISMGKAVGAEAGAEWKSFPDKPHFQITGGISLQTALDRFHESGTIFL
jgi:peptidoglycan LD-endopeptidase CwlK